MSADIRYVSGTVLYGCPDNGKTAKAAFGLDDLEGLSGGLRVYVTYCPACRGSHWLPLEDYVRSIRNASLSKAQAKLVKNLADPKKRA